ncbi:MAG: lamin tail domain-containing protein [Planctomycetes bacterium]|nr:lamin tail domain-containing protein [Planctomycetota bacterium]
MLSVFTPWGFPVFRPKSSFPFTLAFLVFTGPAFPGITITEIHYAPADADGNPQPQLEFVELFNGSPAAFDLTGYRFTAGILFEFIDRTFLSGRSFLVVCKDVDAVKAAYGIDNAVGNFQGILDNAGEEVALANPQGAVVCKVEYNDRGKWPAGAKGTGHSLSLLYEYSDPSEPENWALSTAMGGTPGAPNFGGLVSFQDTVIVDAGAAWRYFKGTLEASNPVTAWRQLDFNDAGWLGGPTGIGYGDGDDATELTDMQNSYLSVFCRKGFTIADTSQIEQLVLNIAYDDGFVVYLNGTQVASRNMNNGTAFNDPASATVSELPVVEDIDFSSFKNLLQNGDNILAVQIHNSSLGSSDLSMIPKLVSRRTIEPGATSSIPVVINEGHCRAASGRFIELYNTSNAAVDLSGYHLTDDFAKLKKHTIPGGTTIPARGWLSFSEAQVGLDLSIVPGVKDRVSIALTNPAGLRVVDAVIFKPEVDQKSEARFPDGARSFAAAADPTPGAENAATVIKEVVFNEIMYHPMSRDDNYEYIELYNRGPASVDLSDWKVEGVGLTFPPGASLASGAYLVIARNPDRIKATYGLSSSAVLGTAWTGSLRYGGERLNLVDPNGNIADTVRFHDGGDWPIWADGGGSSLERIDPMSESDAAASWDASDDSAKATLQVIGYTNVPYGGGESDFGIMLADEGIVLIDDLTLTKAGTGTNLISNGTFDAGTSPWRIEGTHIRSGRTTSPGEVLRGSGSLKLICWNGGGDYKVNRIETDTATQTTGNYNVSFTARWVVGSPRIICIGDYNVSQPQNPGLAGSLSLYLPARLGTPGAANSVTLRQIQKTGSDNLGPAIDQVAHSPGVPEASETVTVRARVRDPDGVSAVRLIYRNDTPAGAFTQAAMADAAGDGVYTATIPGQALGTRVLFYIEAADGQGRLSRYPANPFERTHPPIVNPASPQPNDYLYCMYRHDTRNVSTGNLSYRFVLNQPNQDYLATRRVLSNEMVDGTFIFGSSDVYYNTKVRFAGSPWLRGGGGTWGKSYGIEMPKDHLLHGRKGNFNLDNHGSDGRERISHYLMRYNAGSTILPYFDFQALVRFQLNDVFTSTYEALDKPNADYLEFWFPDAEGGPFFEMDDRFSFDDNGNKTNNAEGHVLYPPYGATSGGGNKENYRWFFIPRGGTNKIFDDFQPLQELCRIMDSRMTADSAFDTQIFNVFDVEEVLRVWSIEMNIDDWDTWAGNRGKNCYFYQSPVDGLWRLIPWDIELTYGDTNSFGMPASASQTYANHFSEIQRMINRPRVKRMYYGILAEQVNTASGFFHSGYLSPLLQRLSSSGVGNTNQVSGFIDTRANSIRNWIRGAVYPQVRLAITTNLGNPLIAAGVTVDLAGDAPADVFYLNVARNGAALNSNELTVAFSNVNMTGWSIKGIPLVPGVNAIEVFGFGSRGELVDSDSIQVTSNVNWNRPAIAEVMPAQGAVGDSVVITGADFHTGLKAIFGSVESTDVTFNEASDPAHITAVVPSGLSPTITAVVVRNLDGQSSLAVLFTVLPPTPKFIRGDANRDNAVDMSDAVRILLHLFKGVSVSCRDALDVNDSGTLDTTDAVYLLLHLFRRGPAPNPPYPAAGSDPPGDSLDCQN